MRKDLFAFRSIAAAAAAAVLGLLFPVVASAQEVASFDSVTGFDSDVIYGALPTDSDSEATINIEGCRALVDDLSDEVTFRWTLDSPEDGASFVIKYQRRGEQCDFESLDVGSDECARAHEPEAVGASISSTSSVATIFGPEFSGDDDCNSTTLAGAYVVGLVHQTTDGTDDDSELDIVDKRVTFNLELDRPDPPSGITVRAGETSVTVRWDDEDSAESYEVYVSSSLSDFDVTYPEDLNPSARTATGTSREVGGLDGMATYYVAVVSVDGNGNRSQISEVTEFSTVPSSDFWEEYRAAGGVEEGGCTATGSRRATPIGLLAIAFGLFLVRRRRCVAATVAAVGLCLVPALASASIVYDTEEDIRGAFELKLGSYTPSIDSEFGSDGAYDRFFGSRTPLLLEVEGDYQFWRGVGSLGVFGSVGWSQVRGNAISSVDGEETNDKTRLRLLPFRAGLVYRFDYLQTRWNVPIAVALKLGLDYYAWFATNDGSISDADTADGGRTIGRGGTTGWHFQVGGYFLLDALAPRMARTFAANTGVDNTYLFAELLSAHVDDFGGKSSWDLSDTTALFGIAFEF